MTAPRKPPPVPVELKLPYEFVNSLDMRRFLQDGAPHIAGDEFASVAVLEAWMRSHGLLESGARLSRSDYQKALELRGALRGLLQLALLDRRSGAGTARLN